MSAEISDSRKCDQEMSMNAFKNMIHRMDGDIKDKRTLVSILERMLQHEQKIPGNALLMALPYREYLKTSHWQKIRRDALSEANNRCSLCNSRDELHCHHRTYQNLGWEQRGDVICLCRDCHKLFHDHRKAEMQGFTPASE